MISHIECSPRRIKRIKTQEKSETLPKDEQAYTFYKLIIHPSIIKLKNERDKLNYSLWLTRLDNEKSDSKMFLIKILFISLKSNQSFYIFLNPPPDDLSELNVIQYDNTMEMLKTIQNNTNIFFANEDIPIQTNAKRSAAVAADMRSYTTTKTSQYMAQTFYGRSDFPINMWHNPSLIVLPNNTDHNEWELYLNHLYIINKNKDTDIKHKHTCEDIMNMEQVSKEIAFSFRWHPHSVLYYDDSRPKKSGCFPEIDQDILNQPFNQQQIDEAAIGIVHKKSFPGYKMLNPRIYSTTLMPDPKFVYNTTGVKIIYNNMPQVLSINYEKENHEEKISKYCPFKQRESSQKNSCFNGNKPCKKPMCNKTIKQQLPCSKTATQNKKKSSCNTNPKSQNQVNALSAGNNFEFIDHNKTNSSNSKSMNKSLGSVCRTKSREKYETNTSPKKQLNNSFSLGNRNQNFTNSKQTDLNNNRANVQNEISNVSNSMRRSSLYDHSNYDWTMSSNEISLDKNYNNTRKNMINNSDRSQMVCKYDQFSPIGPINQNVQYSNQTQLSKDAQKSLNESSKQRVARHYNAQEHEEQRSRHNKSYLSHSSQYNRGHINDNSNTSPRIHNIKKHPKSKQRSASVPCDSNRTYQNSKVKNDRQHCGNQNQSFSGNLKFKRNKTYIEPNKNYSAMENNSERDETLNRHICDENWDPDVSNYNEFSKSHLNNENSLSTSERKRNSTSRRTSLVGSTNNLSEESFCSDWSNEINLHTHQSDCNSKESLSSLTSDSSEYDEPQRPNNSFNYNPTGSKVCNSKNLNRTNEFVATLPDKNDYTNAGIRCPFDDYEQNSSNANHDWPQLGQSADMCNIQDHNTMDVGDDWEDNVSCDSPINYIEDVSMPYMSYDECDLSSFSKDEYSNIESTSMPNISYEHICSEDDDSMSDIRNTEMPNCSYDELSNSNNSDQC